jgi:hypothetical protein
VHDVISGAGVDGIRRAFLLSHNQNVIVPDKERHIFLIRSVQRDGGGIALLQLSLTDLLGKLVVGDIHIDKETAKQLQTFFCYITQQDGERVSKAHPAAWMRSRTVLA